MKKRIIFYPEFNIYGGEERNVVAMCYYLTEWGIPYEVVWYVDNMGLGKYTKNPVTVTQLKPEGGVLSRPLAMGRYLREAAANGSGRIYMGNLQSATHVGLINVPDFVLRVSDTPSLLSSRGKPTLSRIREWATKKGMKKAKAVVATTRYLADELHSLYDIDPVIIPIGGNTDNISMTFRPVCANKQINLMSVCRLEDNKRIDWILRMVKQLDQDPELQYFDFRLEIVGDGTLRKKLEALAGELGLCDLVTFHGFLNDVQLEDVFKRAHIFLMPAKQGFGMPMVEALARGIPTVCNVESGASEYFTDTLWAGLFQGAETEFFQATKRMILNLDSGKIHNTPLPEIPTEENWVRGLVKLLDW